jgi:hypothetical protein
MLMSTQMHGKRPGPVQELSLGSETLGYFSPLFVLSYTCLLLLTSADRTNQCPMWSLLCSPSLPPLTLPAAAT